MTKRAGSLLGSLEKSTDLYDRASVERMAEHFAVLLQGIVRDPGRRVSGLPLLGDPECAAVLAAGRAEVSYPSSRCLHDRFAARAAEAPELVALVSGEEHVRYGELNAYANRMAHRLRGMGVGPEVRVG